MKSYIFLSVLAVLTVINLRMSSQTLSGNYTVGPNGNYTNIAAVATALNGKTITADVLFELQANYTETPAAGITFTSWTGNTTYTVTIRPAADAGTMLSTAGDPGTGAALILMSGTKNLVFDGRAGGNGSTIMWTIQNTRTASSVGPAIQLTNGSNNNTFEYLSIKSSNSQSSSGTVYLYCGTSGPGNSGDIIQNCDIGPNGSNYPANAICAYGYGPSYANSNIKILNNDIHDFVGSNTSGVIVTGTNTYSNYGDNWTISGNSFYRTVNVVNDASVIVINFSSSPNSSGTSSGNIISNNFIGGNASARAGGAIIGTWVTAANTSNSNSFQGINIQAKGATVSGNIIGGIFDVFIGGQSGITGIYVPMVCSGGSLTISGNTIGSTYGPGKFYYGTSSTSIASIGTGSKTLTTQGGLSYQAGERVRIEASYYTNAYYGWFMEGDITDYNSTTGSMTVNVDKVFGSGTKITSWNITTPSGIQNGGQYMMEGIWVASNSGTCKIMDNTIANLTNTNGNSFVTAGIITQNGIYTITGNTIYNLANPSAVSTSQLYTNNFGSVVGISQQGVNGVQTVSNNTVFNLNGTTTSTNANAIYGIELNGESSSNTTHIVDGNFVHSLTVPNASKTGLVYGIYLRTGKYQVSNNMVRLGIRSDASSITGSATFQGITDATPGSSSIGAQKFYHNTVFIGGTSVIAGAINSYCFRRNNKNFTPKDIVDVKNNIFVNNRSNASGTGKNYCIGYENNTQLNTSTEDYNNCYGTGTGFMLANCSSDCGSFAGLSVAAANNNFDLNSITVDPNFVNADGGMPDLKVQKPTTVAGAGFYLTAVPKDIYGTTRANPPTIGAYEIAAECFAVAVNTNPTSPAAVCSGNGVANFTVKVDGTAKFDYQWQQSADGISWSNLTNGGIYGTTAVTNNSDINTNTLIVTNADKNYNNNQYRCVISNCSATNTITSNAVTLTVNSTDAPSGISTQSFCSNIKPTIADLNLTASGTINWYDAVNAGNLLQTSALLINGTDYYASQTISGCESSRYKISVILNNGAIILSQTADQIRCAGDSLTLKVSLVTNEPQPTYQWQLDGENILNATNSSYYEPALSSRAGGNYSCITSNSCGSDTSNIIHLTVNTNISITYITPVTSKCPGDSIRFQVKTSGEGATYQWYKSINNEQLAISNATNSTFDIQHSTLSDAGQYSCKVSNLCAVVAANTELIIKDIVKIDSTSSSSSICDGKSILIKVKASGDELSYQWSNMGSNITDATNSSYSIALFRKTDEGLYQCIVRNSCNSITSGNIILTLNSSPTVNTIPQNIKLTPGDPLNLTVTAQGNGPFSYQWVKSVNNEQLVISNETNSTYSIQITTLADAGIYNCKVTNLCGTSLAAVAVVSFNVPNSYIISGNVVYENSSLTPMNNTSVYLFNENDIPLDTVITDVEGNFTINKVQNGIYKLNFSTTNLWAGSNPLDALFVNRTFIDLYTPTSELYAKAADVTGDGIINPLDALYINRRYIGFIDTFTSNDWIFEEPVLTVNGQDLIVTVKCICAGDINGSYPSKK